VQRIPAIKKQQTIDRLRDRVLTGIAHEYHRILTSQPKKNITRKEHATLRFKIALISHMLVRRSLAQGRGWRHTDLTTTQTLNLNPF
jgi:hypothetical protein